MTAYTDGLNEAAYNAFCDVTRAGVAAGVITAAFTAATGAGILGGIALAGVSAHLYASYCGRPPGVPPTGEPQDWEGGQCEDVLYRVAVTIDLYLLPKTANISVGPVGDVFYPTGPISLIEVYDTGDTDNDIRIRASWKGGSKDGSFVKGTNNDPENPQWGYQNPQIVVTREDGLPDICGNPPPTPPPPPGFDAPYPFTYPTPEGDTINAPVTFNFGPAFIGVGAAVFIPVNLRFDLNPTLNISGTINVNTGNFSPTFGPPDAPITGDNGPGDVVTPPGPPPGPLPPGMPPDPVTPPEEDKKPLKTIRGVVVTSSINALPATVIFQQENPDIYAPNLGFVAFLIKTTGGFAWTADIPVKNTRQIIQCPWNYGAVDVRGTAQSGVLFSLKPIFDVVGYQ